MSDIKWIKLDTGVFDNRKIKQIQKMPEGDTIIVIWFKLLVLAGNLNDQGMIYFTKEVPYTEEMLSAEFDRPLQMVRLALNVFESFSMIEIIDNIYCISSWEKYQNVDGMDKIREQNRIRQERFRGKLKIEDKSNVDVTLHNGTDKEEDKEKEKNKDNKKPPKHKHGEYHNVLLTDIELDKLKTEFPNDYTERIEKLSRYVESTGKSYKSHLATIRNWALKDKAPQKKAFENQRNYDFGKLEEELLK